MVNLLSNDVNRYLFPKEVKFLSDLLIVPPRRFDQTIIFLHYLWCAPLQLAIVTGLLYQRIGPYALVVSLKLIQCTGFQ